MSQNKQFNANINRIQVPDTIIAGQAIREIRQLGAKFPLLVQAVNKIQALRAEGRTITVSLIVESWLYQSHQNLHLQLFREMQENPKALDLTLTLVDFSNTEVL